MMLSLENRESNDNRSLGILIYSHTCPIAVIPDERLIQKAVPIIIMFPVFPPFLISSTLKISSKNGINATNKTDGEINSPIKVTAASKKHTKHHGLRLAILFVIKFTVHRLTKLVFDKGYTSINVKIKNATVVLPKAPLNVSPNPKLGRKPNKSIVIRLGQSMDTVIHIISDRCCK